MSIMFILSDTTETRSNIFENQMHHMFSHVRDRLDRYASETAAGRWNETIFDDFRSDHAFSDDARSLNEYALTQLPQFVCPDGSSIFRIDIEFHRTIHIAFEISVLTGGYRAIPATYTLTRNNDDTYTAEYACGLKNQTGGLRLCSVPLSTDLDPFPKDPKAWIIRRHKTYGEQPDGNPLRKWTQSQHAANVRTLSSHH